MHYVDTYGMILSLKTPNFIEDLKTLENIFDFSNLDEDQKLFRKINQKVIGKFKLETSKNIWIDEFVCLRNKMYSFKCGNDNGSKNKLKSTSNSQSKHIIFENYKKCLGGVESQKNVINNCYVHLSMKIFFKK